MKWENIKQNPLPNLKISPLAMISHKSRIYRAILDVSFLLKVAGWDPPPVKEAKKETAPSEALEHVGMIMRCIIKALATASLSEEPIHLSKLDIKYGFWRIVWAVREEWKFAYVLPNHLETPTKLVILSAL